MKNPLHLIIDGSDNLGKTTIINLLSRKLDLPVIKMTNMGEYIKDGDAEKYSRLYNETIVQFSEFNFIMDRGFTSSLVYSEVFARTDDLSYIKNIEQKLKPIVFILTGRTNLINDYHKGIRYTSFSSDPIYQIEEKQEIDESFCKLSEEKRYHIVEVFGKSPLEICNEIIEQLNEQL